MTAPAPSPAEQAVIDRFEAAPAAPESFDPIAAVRRVEALADQLDSEAETAEQVAFSTVSANRRAAARRIRAALAPQADR